MAKKDEKVAKRAQKAVEKWRSYFKRNIDQYHFMFDFVLGEQWTDEESDVLRKYQKTPMQFNKLATLINTLLGEQQQNTPQLAVVPKEQCSEQNARIREIITKDLMLSQNTRNIYQRAAKQAFVGGFGVYVLGTEYEHDRSFDQKITYYNLKDATRAYWDISAENEDKTDGMYGGYISRMSRKKFRAKFGKRIEQDIRKTDTPGQTKEEVRLATSSGSAGDNFNWADDDGITIVDHFERQFTKSTLYKLSNGKVVEKDEMDRIVEQSKAIASMVVDEVAEEVDGVEEVEEDEIMVTLYDEGEPIRIEDERSISKSKIMHYKIAGNYVLESTEFPAEDIPVIFVDHNSYFDKNGEQVCCPFLLYAIDAQRYLNYLGTQSAFILKVSRYDQYIGSKKNVQSEHTARIWKNPQAQQGLLVYDESPSGAKPERVQPPELSQSLMQQYQRAIDDMYTSTGLYPARMGQEGNEISGAAIDARTRQGSYPTYIAFTAINRAITAGGKIVNQMIPRVYDTERVMTLMTPDRGRQNIVINQQADAYGEQINNDIRQGTFEVELKAGPSYEGQKAQALESLNTVLQSNPSTFNLIADLYADNLPLSNTIEIKNRLKTLVPPEIVQAGESGQMPQQAQTPSPQDQAALASIKQKQEEIEIKKQELQLKMQEAQAKNELKMMELEMKKLEVAGELEEQKLRYLAETDRTHSDNAIAHADNITKILTQKMENS